MNSSLSAKKAFSSSSRSRSSKPRIIRFSFNTFIILIFSTCIVFYAILSVHIHSKLKLQQHDQKEAVDNNNNNNEHVNVVNSINVNVNARRSSSIQNHPPLDNNNIHNNSNNNNFRPVVKQLKRQRQKEEEKINNDNNNNNNNNGNRKHYDNDSKNNNNNKNKNNKKGLSACLLVNDENPRLPEWIAYHYQMLPLRSLTITVDPASRSSPIEILNRWTNTNTQNHNKEMKLGLEVQIWEEKDFLPKEDSYGSIRHGACNASDVDTDCLWQHRKRQRYFIKKCMADFKQRNMTWVLLIDVDEYITFNRIRDKDDDDYDDDDPNKNVPLDYAPEGVPTLSDWKKKEYRMVDSVTGELVTDVRVEGTITGLPENGLNGKKNGDQITTGSLVTQHMDHLLGIHGVAYGNVVEESSNNNNNDTNNDGSRMKYYLRDDFAFRDAVPMAHAPGGVPTLKHSYMNGTSLHATIYDAAYYYTGKTKKKDGESIRIETNWRESPPNANTNTLSGGHLMLGTDGQTYYVERERGLWPPHLSSKESMDIRKRLPVVGDGTTVMDVLEREAEIFGEYAKEAIGPCLSMPRLLFGSHEEDDDHDHDHRSSSTNNNPNSTTSWTTSNNNNNNMAPEGFVDEDFVTLRYTWHAIKEASVNKFQKAIVDVSRLRMDSFGGEAENIHVPLKYYCRRDPPRYSTSFLRVNHYLDSFEAYSYRNDARSSKRQCRECYDEKGKEAAASMDDDIRPWIKSFFRQVGPQKAKQLLAGAGNFVRLS